MRFETGQFYHIYNRGVDKRDVFTRERDFVRFLESMREFNRIDPVGSLRESKNLKNRKNFSLDSRHSMSNFPDIECLESLVDIVCYCLNLNHYHLLLRQTGENGNDELFLPALCRLKNHRSI